MKEYRICEFCEHQNDVSLLECVKCGADLSFIAPSTALVPMQPRASDESNGKATVRMTQLKMISTKDGYEITIPWEGGVVGREGTIAPEYFADNPFVSNEHAQIRYDGSGCVLIDHRSTNGTKLNGIRLEKGQAYPLNPNDRIVFANIEFRVQDV